MVFDRIEYYKNYWKNNPEMYEKHKLNCKNNSKKRIELFKIEHPTICVSCFKNKRKIGIECCLECSEKRKKYMLYKREVASKKHICITCFKNKVSNGYKMCKICIQRNMINTKNNNELKKQLKKGGYK